MALYYTFVLGGAKGAIVQSTYSMLSPHSLNTVPLDSSQLTLKTLLFPQWLKKAVRSKKENVGFGIVSHCKPFRKQESEGKRWPVSVEGTTHGPDSRGAGGGDCEAQCLKDFAAYLKWIFHAKLLFLIL